MKTFLRQCRIDMQQLLALRAKRGPYRFLVRRWGKAPDIDLALRVLATEFFLHDIVSLPLPIKELRSVLVIAPHQDDETIGAGGSLLLAAAAGVKIDILFLTDGAQNKTVYAPTPADTARVRDEEAARVCAKLGARMHHLGISNVEPNPTVAHLDRLAEIFHELKPAVVMAPWILDAPAKHRLVNHLLFLANHRRKLPDCEVWGYQVHNTLYANGYVDITSVAEQKRSLLECFRSQNEHITRYDHMAMGLAAWNARYLENSLEPRYAEVFFTLPLHEMFGLIKSFYLPNLEGVYHGNSRLVGNARELQRAVMSNGAKTFLSSWRRESTPSNGRVRPDGIAAAGTEKATIKA